MSISFNCPHCSKRLSVPDQSASKKGRCQECGAVIAIADVLVLQNYERIRKSVHRDNLAHRDEGDDDPAVFLTDDADVLFRLLLLANPIAVRGDICRRLVALGLGHTIVPRLKGKLVHRESHIRRAAALALLPFAHESPDDLLKPIRALLNDDDSNTRYAVGRELLLLHDDKAAVPVVQEHMQELRRQPFNWSAIKKWLYVDLKRFPALVNTRFLLMTTALKQSPLEHKGAIAMQLRYDAPGPATAVADIISLLKENKYVKRDQTAGSLISVLASYGPLAKEALPLLESALLFNTQEQEGTSCTSISEPAIIAVGAIGPESIDVLPSLVRILSESSHAKLRELAADALGRIDPTGAFCMPALLSALHDRCDSVRNQACVVLGNIALRRGQHDSKIIDAVKRVIIDSDEHVRLTAMKVLLALGVKPEHPIQVCVIDWAESLSHKRVKPLALKFGGYVTGSTAGGIGFIFPDELSAKEFILSCRTAGIGTVARVDDVSSERVYVYDCHHDKELPQINETSTRFSGLRDCRIGDSVLYRFPDTRTAAAFAEAARSLDFLDPISMKPFLDSFPVRIVTEFKTVEYNKHAVRELAKQFGGKQFNSREYYEVFEFPHEDPATQFVGACQKLPDFKTASMKRLPPRLESSD